MYVVALWFPMDTDCPIQQGKIRHEATIQVLKYMTMTDSEAFGILIAGEKRCYGCVAYTEEPLALFNADNPLPWPNVKVYCTHSFVDTLKKYRRIVSPNDTLVYKNLKSRMTSKSCNRYCLQNVIDDDDVLCEVVEEHDANLRRNAQN